MVWALKDKWYCSRQKGWGWENTFHAEGVTCTSIFLRIPIPAIPLLWHCAMAQFTYMSSPAWYLLMVLYDNLNTCHLLLLWVYFHLVGWLVGWLIAHLLLSLVFSRILPEPTPACPNHTFILWFLHSLALGDIVAVTLCRPFDLCMLLRKAKGGHRNLDSGSSSPFTDLWQVPASSLVRLLNCQDMGYWIKCPFQIRKARAYGFERLQSPWSRRMSSLFLLESVPFPWIRGKWHSCQGFLNRFWIYC